MKVGIITINDFNNYGNRLQCYAVQEVLKKNGIEPENIYNDNIDFSLRIKRTIKKIIKTLLLKEKQLAFNKRRKLFNKFNNNIKFSKYRIINGKANFKINDKYDYFIVGSDQVWNPEFNTTSNTDFLTFAADEKKVSFSASFGVNKLDEKVKKYYKEKLEKFKGISVREESGKKIIEELIDNKNVEVLVDPTMLLNVDEWDKVSEKPKQLHSNMEKKYILNYFLGNLKEEWKKEIERIAIENDCEIINILDKKSDFYSTGPSEFLYLEKNAFMICTDSFHSSVFAIIYDTPFIVFEREDAHASMSSRLDTLLKKFKLENRKFNGKITNDLLIDEFIHTKEILENERKKSINFLKNALEEQKKM